ncbi:MAG: HAMP domain-containing histidine kinase [Pseudomonadales bacterium]|nr:HAMP domain-containing histidine kinase [Pseudomonadales bacterium]
MPSIFFGLSRLLLALALSLIIIVTLLFLYFGNEALIDAVKNTDQDANAAITDINSILKRRSLLQLKGEEKQADPLIPIPFSYLPSPFNDKDSSRFKQAHPLQTYYSQSDVSSQVAILAGYSNVMLTSGRHGNRYLSILAWIKPNDLNLYGNSQQSRLKSDHIWLLYHDTDNQLQSVFVSLENVEVSSENSENNRVGVVSGYIATQYKNTSNLRLDSTIKGSLFKAKDNDYLLSFRMRVNSLKNDSRPNIDISRPLGLSLNIGIINDSKANIIETFSLKNGGLVDAPHLSGESINQSLKSLNSNITNIVLTDKNGAELHLLSRTIPDYQSGGLSYDVLKVFFARKIDDDYRVILDKHETVLIEIDEPINLIGTSGENFSLRITMDTEQRLAPLIKKLTTLLWIYVAVIFAISITIVTIYSYIIRRILKLTDAVKNFQLGKGNALESLSGNDANEIDFLTNYIIEALTSVNSARKRTEYRLQRRSELMSIMGHNIRTPLASLLAMHEGREDSVKYLKKNQRASDFILDANKLDNLFSEEHMAVIDACNFFQGVANELDKIHTVSVDFLPSDSPVMIRVNEEYLEEAIDGITGNAVDFGEKITIKVFEANDKCVIEISNDGPAIPPDVMKSIFEYGFSTRIEDTDDHYGIGLFGASFQLKVFSASLIAENRDNEVVFIIQFPIQEPGIRSINA